MNVHQKGRPIGKGQDPDTGKGNRNYLGLAIKAERNRQGLSQDALTTLAFGYARKSYLSTVESGAAGIDLTNTYLLAQALGKTVDELIHAGFRIEDEEKASAQAPMPPKAASGAVATQ